MYLRLYGYRVTRAHFAKDGASLLTWYLGWLLLSFHSQVSHFGQYILWTPTLLASDKQLTCRSVWLTPKPGLSVNPGYFLEFQITKLTRKVCSQSSFIHSANIYWASCMWHCVGRHNLKVNRAQFQVFFSLGLMRKQTIWILIVRAGHIVYITCVKWKAHGLLFKNHHTGWQ